MSTTTILTQADLATILAQHGCTPELKPRSFCVKGGVGHGLFAYARRADGSHTLLGMWEVIRARSEDEMRDLVESRLSEGMQV